MVAHGKIVGRQTASGPSGRLWLLQDLAKRIAVGDLTDSHELYPLLPILGLGTAVKTLWAG